jgi:hypothetical protein
MWSQSFLSFTFYLISVEIKPCCYLVVHRNNVRCSLVKAFFWVQIALCCISSKMDSFWMYLLSTSSFQIIFIMRHIVDVFCASPNKLYFLNSNWTKLIQDNYLIWFSSNKHVHFSGYARLIVISSDILA